MSRKAALPSEVDVLIAGFGPTGATLANLLGRYGVSTLIVDKAPDILMQPRAIALDNEALRILQMAGLEETAFEKIAIPRVRMQSPYVGEFACVNTAGCLDGHPKLVTFYQPELEVALRKSLAKYSKVHYATGVEVSDFSDTGNKIQVDLVLEGGAAHSVTCRYLVGADGAGSPIRSKLGLDFDGQTYAQDWLIVDARNVRKPITDVEFLCNPQRPVPHMIAPGGRERWEFMLKPGETSEQVLKPAFIRELLKPWANQGELDIERTAVYRFHARVAHEFRRGNVFLVGDAAHITPPFVGQGLCAGLRDVANLGWKLAWVISGLANEEILDTYDRERRPHAKAMIDLARAMGLLIKPNTRLAALATANLVKGLRQVPLVRDLFNDLKIKPKNRFQQGLFVARSKLSRLDRGNHLPQVLLRQSGQEGLWSDDVLGDKMTLMGFGVNPEALVSPTQLKKWKAAGGTLVQIAHRGQTPGANTTCPLWEDLTGALVPELAPVGWLAVVRPDRVIMHDAPATEADRMVVEALNLLKA
ncbi:MAG: bifunctional 3-(3-hydroxy-phenyl)propionate/3-hydroxycinnamic acid hydroxylase [Hahellaceae bacterium]|nr:bifunctional 3-(3-hydroxy-phenyl)propionate/3-hydroxycinnamic acid hydroxylase [Hahellaceae bacterium]